MCLSFCSYLMQAQKRDMNLRGEGAEMIWENGIDIYTLPCVTQMTSGNLLYNRELSAMLCDDLEG